MVRDRKEWRYVALLIFGGMQFLCPGGRLVFSYSSLFLMGMVVFLCRQRFISTAETLALLCICAVYSYFQFAELLTVSLDNDHGVPVLIEAADVAVGVVAGLILLVCTVSVTRN